MTQTSQPVRLVPVKAMISRDERDDLQRLAEREGTSTSEQIRRAIIEYLERLG